MPEGGFLPVYAEGGGVDGPEDAGLGIGDCEVDVEGVRGGWDEGVDVGGAGDDGGVVAFGGGAAGVRGCDTALRR